VITNWPFASKVLETDPLGHQTAKRFNSIRQMISLTNAEGRTKSFSYDGLNLARETDFKG